MRNFQEYHRPDSLEAASALLRRNAPRTAVLAGGTWLTGEAPGEIEAVVDIAKLGLDQVRAEGRSLSIGAAVTLQSVVKHALFGESGSSAGLRIIGETAAAMAGLSIRNRATIGGAIATADSASPLVTALLACDAEVVCYGVRPINSPGVRESELIQSLPLTGFLQYGAQLRERGALMTTIRLPIPSDDTRSRYERVARTPKDYPIVCVAAQFAQHKGIAGNMRVAAGGVGPMSLRLSRIEFGLEKKNINEFIDAELREQGALLAPPDDFLGSAEYRRDMALTLARRAIMAVA